MIAKRILKDNRYHIYLLPEDIDSEIDAGIPFKMFTFSMFDLEKIEYELSNLLSQYIVKNQNTPNMDTLNQILRTVILRELNKLGETIYE